MANDFEYLSGNINISAALPDHLQKNGLDPFYEDPNNTAWGDTLCRVLYHESIHFWQFLASGYIANLVSEEWKRLNHFEETGEIIPQSEFLKKHIIHPENCTFSAFELVECWARYWDVHTRSPALIIKEEGIDISDLNLSETSSMGTYSWIDYDTVMQKGKDSHFYAEPYRWLLEKASGNSYLVALLFPIITHAAFGSPAPVEAFTACFERAMQPNISMEIMQHRSGNINFDWLNSWNFVKGEILSPVLEEKNLPFYTSGFDVISRGELSDHPIYRDYPERMNVLWKHLELMNVLQSQDKDITESLESSMQDMENYALKTLPMQDPWVIFGLPGQPIYRYLLGHYLSPPGILFSDFNHYTRQTISLGLLKEEKIEEGETYELQSQKLELQIKRFRAAEKAVSLGLAPDAFE